MPGNNTVAPAVDTSTAAVQSQQPKAEGCPGAQPHPSPKHIGAKDVEGTWWSCGPLYLPICWHLFSTSSQSDDTITQKGYCMMGPVPICPIRRVRERWNGTRFFTQRSSRDFVEYYSDRCSCNSLTCCACASCGRKCCFSPKQNQEEILSASDLEGAWLWCCWPLCCAIVQNHAIGTDVLEQKGVWHLLVIPVSPFQQTRTRKPRTAGEAAQGSNNTFLWQENNSNTNCTNDDDPQHYATQDYMHQGHKCGFRCCCSKSSCWNICTALSKRKGSHRMRS
eukprot:m.91627 g.91627  ORF g.91627 m.91627 type:complete len:279 (+) comp18232_c1_seq1:543-1379(+)